MTGIVVVPFPGRRRDAGWQGYQAETVRWLTARGVSPAEAEARAREPADVLFGIGPPAPPKAWHWTGTVTP